MAASSLLLLLLLLGLLDPQPATIYNYYLCGYARNIIMICWGARYSYDSTEGTADI